MFNLMHNDKNAPESTKILSLRQFHKSICIFCMYMKVGKVYNITFAGKHEHELN